MSDGYHHGYHQPRRPMPPQRPRKKRRPGRIILVLLLVLVLGVVGFGFYVDSSLKRIDALPDYEGRPAETPGTTALATASHSIAASYGYPDGEQIPRDLMIEAVGRIAAATELPVSADLEAGYGDPGGTIARAIDVGIVGNLRVDHFHDGTSEYHVDAAPQVLDALEAAHPYVVDAVEYVEHTFE